MMNSDLALLPNNWGILASPSPPNAATRVSTRTMPCKWLRTERKSDGRPPFTNDGIFSTRRSKHWLNVFSKISQISVDSCLADECFDRITVKTSERQPVNRGRESDL